MPSRKKKGMSDVESTKSDVKNCSVQSFSKPSPKEYVRGMVFLGWGDGGRGRWAGRRTQVEALNPNCTTALAKPGDYKLS